MAGLGPDLQDCFGATKMVDDSYNFSTISKMARSVTCLRDNNSECT